MHYLLSFLSAACIAIMLVPNGQLSQAYDFYTSTVIIHVVGLLATTLVMIIKREKFRILKKVPLILYIGGLVGVGTTLFNNIAYGHISVSAILALSLFGQAITSILIDHFGFFHMPVQKFTQGKLFGLLFTMLGIETLLYGSGFDLVAVILSLLTGVTIVVARCINAELAQESSVWTSTWYNYFIGLITCGIIWVIATMAGKSSFTFEINQNPWIYMGGLLSVIAVAVMNIVTKKMPAFSLNTEAKSVRGLDFVSFLILKHHFLIHN